MTEPTTVETAACDLCGDRKGRPVHTVGGWLVVRCAGCGLERVAHPPTAAELVELYAADTYWESPDTTGYTGYAAAEGRKRRHFRTLLDRIESLGPRPPGDLLELGPGYGFFLDEARARGWRVRGVEPSEHAASQARERFGLDVAWGALEDQPPEEASADVIALWDVIEHLPSPSGVLRLAARRLRPGGLLALSTGDAGSLAARLHGRDWSLMTPPWHLFFFTRTTLERAVRDAGLDIVAVDSDGVVAVDPASPRPRIPGPLRRLLLAPSVVRVARRLGVGSTLFVFARRR